VHLNVPRWREWEPGGCYEDKYLYLISVFKPPSLRLDQVSPIFLFICWLNPNFFLLRRKLIWFFKISSAAIILESGWTIEIYNLKQQLKRELFISHSCIRAIMTPNFKSYSWVLIFLIFLTNNIFPLFFEYFCLILNSFFFLLLLSLFWGFEIIPMLLFTAHQVNFY